MSRDQKLLFISVALLAGAIYFLRHTYSSAGTTGETAAPVYASTQSPIPETPPAAEIPSTRGAAYELIPSNRSAQDQEIIDHAKNAPASMLDSSLPHQSAGFWIAHAAGSYARLRWEVNNCATPHQQQDSSPVCAQANLEFPNGTKFQALLLLGEQPLSSPGLVKYSQPSLLWASYQKRRGALTPASLGLLQRIGQDAD